MVDGRLISGSTLEERSKWRTTHLQMQGIFPDPARPQPFQEELLSGGSSFVVGDAMEVNHLGAA